MLSIYRPSPLRIFIMLLLVSVLTTETSKQAGAHKITPTVDGIIRDGLEGPKDGVADSVIGGSVVQTLDGPTFEDRGIIEFDILSLPDPAPGALLNLSVFGSVGPFPFTVDVFTYTGDGLLTLGDFNSGSLFTSFSYSGGSVVILDLTTLDLASLRDIAGFRFEFADPSTIPRGGPFVAFNSLQIPPAAILLTAEIPCDRSASPTCNN